MEGIDKRTDTLTTFDSKVLRDLKFKSDEVVLPMYWVEK